MSTTDARLRAPRAGTYMPPSRRTKNSVDDLKSSSTPGKQGPLAQLVEQETLNLLVVGSIPTRPTNYPFSADFQRPPGASAEETKILKTSHISASFIVHRLPEAILDSQFLAG